MLQPLTHVSMSQAAVGLLHVACECCMVLMLQLFPHISLNSLLTGMGLIAIWKCLLLTSCGLHVDYNRITSNCMCVSLVAHIAFNYYV